MNRRRILHITTSFPLYQGHPSGWFVWNQVRPLPALGWDTTVLAPHAAGAAVEEDMEDIRVVRYRYLPESMEQVSYGGGIMANLRENKLRLLSLFPFLLAGKKKASRLGRSMDLIHAHWSYSALLATSAAGTARAPIVVSFHGSDLMGASKPMLALAEHAAKIAAGLIVHSRAMEKSLSAFAPREKILRLAHGVDVDSFEQADPDAPGPVRIIAVGRLAEEKGFALLIDSLSRLPEALEWNVEIIGDGQQRQRLESSAKEKGVFDRVHFAGELPHPEVVKRLARSHIAVVPSLREGFGMAALEQSAAGLPVVATDCGGLADIVLESKTGHLVPPEKPDALSAALQELIQNPEKRSEMGRQGRSRAKTEFSLGTVSARLVDFYEKIISDNNQ